MQAASVTQSHKLVAAQAPQQQQQQQTQSQDKRLPWRRQQQQWQQPLAAHQLHPLWCPEAELSAAGAQQ
jgi:hypothetical protein